MLSCPMQCQNNDKHLVTIGVLWKPAKLNGFFLFHWTIALLKVLNSCAMLWVPHRPRTAHHTKKCCFVQLFISLSFWEQYILKMQHSEWRKGTTLSIFSQEYLWVTGIFLFFKRYYGILGMKCFISCYCFDSFIELDWDFFVSLFY